MTTLDLLTHLRARGVLLTANGDHLAFDAPVGTMTPELIARLAAHKNELLAALADKADAPAEAQLETHADREWARFEAVCLPRPDGRGWYDPGNLQDAAGWAYLGHLAGRQEPSPCPQIKGRQPDLYDVDGRMMTFAERAEYYRNGWRVNGYPPGVSPKGQTGDDK